MANSPITPVKVNYATGDVLTAQNLDDEASALNRLTGLSTQVTSTTQVTLTVSSNKWQEFTGTTASQVVQMPVTSTLGVGMDWIISNKSTQTIAVNSSGGNLIFTVPAATDWRFTCNAITGTTAASWSNSYAGASATPASGGETLLSTTTLSGASTTCPSIANTYKHIKVRLVGVYGTSNGDVLSVRLNGDSGANYYNENFAGSATSPSAEGVFAGTSFYRLVRGIPTSSAVARAGFLELDILRYTDVGAVMVNSRGNGAGDAATGIETVLGSGRYVNAAAISTVTILLVSGTLSGGTMYVYGVD